VASLAGGGKGPAAGSVSGLSGFQVQSGGATLSTPSSTKSVITQSTNKAIINSKPPTQAHPLMQDYYVTLLGGMLYELRELPGARQGNTNTEEDTDFSGWGNETKW
jgi:hypothetical protein